MYAGFEKALEAAVASGRIAGAVVRVLKLDRPLPVLQRLRFPRGTDIEEMKALAGSMVDAGLASDEATAMIVLSTTTVPKEPPR